MLCYVKLCYVSVCYVSVCYMYAVSGSLTARVNCDDRPSVFVDGEFKGKNEQDFNWSGEVADNVKLIAVECRNNGGFGGLLVSVDGLLISDVTWKCSRTRTANWHREKFDDSLWVNAYVIGSNSGSVKDEDPTIPNYAQWIWADDRNNAAGTIFCRGRTGKHWNVCDKEQ